MESSDARINQTPDDHVHTEVQISDFTRGLLGLVIVFIVITIALVNGEYAQYSYQSIEFTNYWFLNYCVGCFMTLSLPVLLVIECTLMFLYLLARGRISINVFYFIRNIYWKRVTTVFRESPVSRKRLVVVSVPLCILNFGSSVFWFASLNLVPVALVTTLFSSVVIWVFVLSVIFLKEKLSVIKVLSVILVMAGVAVIAFGATTGETFSSHLDTFLGCMVVLLSALLYGFYEIVFVKLLANHYPEGKIMHYYEICLVQSLMGICTFSILWVGIPIESYLIPNRESVFDFSGDTWLFLLVNSILASSYYNFLTFGIIITSPLYITISTLLSIPVTGIADHILHDDIFNWVAILGACLIVISIILINMQQIQSYAATQYQKWVSLGEDQRIVAMDPVVQ